MAYLRVRRALAQALHAACKTLTAAHTLQLPAHALLHGQAAPRPADLGIKAPRGGAEARGARAEAPRGDTLGQSLAHTLAARSARSTGPKWAEAARQLALELLLQLQLLLSLLLRRLLLLLLLLREGLRACLRLDLILLLRRLHWTDTGT